MTELCAERLSFLVVSSANQRSTRLIHERAGRGEVQLEARVREQPAFDQRRLVRGGVIEDEVHVEVGRDLVGRSSARTS